MSTNESTTDTELRDLIVQNLESNGVLRQIRAQLRASTFLALDQRDDPEVKFPMVNRAVEQLVSTRDGVLAVSLISEFLAFYKMQFSLSVFEPETFCDSHYKVAPRAELAEQVLGCEPDPHLPVLQTLLAKLKVNGSNDATFTAPNINDRAAEPQTAFRNVQPDEYDEDFQSSTAVSSPRDKAASVEEEIDVSDLLGSRASDATADTVDQTASNSSLAADYVEKI